MTFIERRRPTLSVTHVPWEAINLHTEICGTVNDKDKKIRLSQHNKILI